MKKIGRKLYHENISDADAVKALALLIFVKIKFPSSVVANFSYYKLAKVTGIHYNTIKKRLNTLGDMELLDFEGKYNQHLRFKRVRAKKSNVNFSRIDTTSVKTIERGLRALYLVEKVSQKNYVEQQVNLAHNGERTKQVKRAKSVCEKRGYTDFNDYGISYKYLAKKLNLSLGSTSAVVKYAVKAKLVNKHRTIKQVSYVNSKAKICLSIFDDVKGYFATKHNIYKIGCNTYSLFVEQGATAK